MLKGLFAVFSAKISGYLKGLKSIITGTQGAANSVNQSAGQMRDSLNSAFSGQLRNNIANLSESISETKDAIVATKAEIIILQDRLKKQKEGTKAFQQTEAAIKNAQKGLKELNLELANYNIAARDQKKGLADSRLAAEDNSAAMEATSRAVNAATGAILLLGDGNESLKPVLKGVSIAMAGVNAVIAVQNLRLRENQVFANLSAKAQAGLRAAFIGTTAAGTALKSILSSLGIGLAIVAISTLIGKLMDASKATAEAEESQKKFNEAYAKFGGSEIAKVNLLIGQIEDLSLSLDTRKSALKKLQEIFPAYFKNLDEEKILSGQVRIETNKLTSAILANAKAKALQQRVEENAVKLLPKQEELLGAQKTLDQAQKTLTDGSKKQSATYVDLAKTVSFYEEKVNNLKNEINDLNVASAKYADEIKKLNQQTDPFIGADAEEPAKVKAIKAKVTKESKQAVNEQQKLAILEAQINGERRLLFATTEEERATIVNDTEKEILAIRKAYFIQNLTAQGASQTQALESWSQYQLDVIKAQQDADARLLKAKDKDTDNLVKAEEVKTAMIEEAQQGTLEVYERFYREELGAAAERYNKGEMSLELYNQQIKDITLEGLQARLQLLKDFGLSTAEVEKQIADLSVKTVGDAEKQKQQLLKQSNRTIQREFQNLFEGLGEAYANAITSIANGGDPLQALFSGVLLTVASFMESFGKAILSVGIALLKLDVALKSLNPFLAIAGGIALIAAAGVAKSMASKGVTPFADGGIVSGPTLGLVGEYPGASTNPEVIAPLDKLKSIIGGSGDDSGFIAETRISGRDLSIVLNRFNKDNARG
jgi:hypothetical protein